MIVVDDSDDDDDGVAAMTASAPSSPVSKPRAQQAPAPPPPAPPRVFICDEKFLDLKQALLDRGWTENPITSSPCFDLKWRNYRNINFRLLRPDQVGGRRPGRRIEPR